MTPPRKSDMSRPYPRRVSSLTPNSTPSPPTASGLYEGLPLSMYPGAEPSGSGSPTGMSSTFIPGRRPRVELAPRRRERRSPPDLDITPDEAHAAAPSPIEQSSPYEHRYPSGPMSPLGSPVSPLTPDAPPLAEPPLEEVDSRMWRCPVTRLPAPTGNKENHELRIGSHGTDRSLLPDSPRWRHFQQRALERAKQDCEKLPGAHKQHTHIGPPAREFPDEEPLAPTPTRSAPVAKRDIMPRHATHRPRAESRGEDPGQAKAREVVGKMGFGDEHRARYNAMDAEGKARYRRYMAGKASGEDRDSREGRVASSSGPTSGAPSRYRADRSDARASSSGGPPRPSRPHRDLGLPYVTGSAPTESRPSRMEADRRASSSGGPPRPSRPPRSPPSRPPRSSPSRPRRSPSRPPRPSSSADVTGSAPTDRRVDRSDKRASSSSRPPRPSRPHRASGSLDVTGSAPTDSRPIRIEASIRPPIPGTREAEAVYGSPRSDSERSERSVRRMKSQNLRSSFIEDKPVDPVDLDPRRFLGHEEVDARLRERKARHDEWKKTIAEATELGNSAFSEFGSDPEEDADIEDDGDKRKNLVRKKVERLFGKKK
ncbi:hypothetical protein EJ06DRAFT_560193 [Trichodelitschia bisporula]|uniref:Uncharacterized protein n=1 Tax=Trichodelitschia bisporula TaxID=703511 RepID=A0A6G1HJT5_9PEZI|nr:hypothetical protein EJ06DRAFT_560193 [Trichodelitschia bisporula]